MSALVPDNISPIAPDHFQDMPFPKSQLALRIVTALLVLAYAWFVPAQLTLVSYSVFLIGIIIYIALQSLFGLAAILNRSSPALLHAITAIDLIGGMCVLINDPATLPPTLVLPFATTAIAAMHYRFQAYTIVFAGALLATLLTCLVRQQLLGQAWDFYIASFILLATATASISLLVSAQIESQYKQTARVTETDPLTGLGNRWTFYEASKYLLPYHQRNMTPMVVMFADIEVTRRKGKNLGKTINQYLLKQFASIIDQRLRSSDVAVHYGGNEFAMLLVDTTTKDAETIAFDLQQQFNTWAKQKDLPAYAHIGMAVVPQRPIAMDQILISINAALYRARQYKKGVSGAVFADPESSR
ncbi:MAG: GGDEF domain-containing protein [Moraxellaceae bacterium]|nr:GGDEF domain-containing protein [Moraxellaceae bacterium]